MNSRRVLQDSYVRATLYGYVGILGIFWLGVLSTHTQLKEEPFASFFAWMTAWAMLALHILFLSMCTRSQSLPQRDTLRTLPVSMGRLMAAAVGFSATSSVLCFAVVGVLLILLHTPGKTVLTMLLANMVALALPAIYYSFSIWRRWAWFRSFIRVNFSSVRLLYVVLVIGGLYGMTKSALAISGAWLFCVGIQQLALTYGKSMWDINLFWFLDTGPSRSRRPFFKFSGLYLRDLSPGLLIVIFFPWYLHHFLRDLSYASQLLLATILWVVAMWPIGRVFYRDQAKALWTLPLRPWQLLTFTSVIPGTILVVLVACALAPLFSAWMHIPPAMTLTTFITFCGVMYGSKKFVYFSISACSVFHLGVCLIIMFCLLIGWCMTLIGLYVAFAEGGFDAEYAQVSTTASWLLIPAVLYAGIELFLLYRRYGQLRPDFDGENSLGGVTSS